MATKISRSYTTKSLSGAAPAATSVATTSSTSTSPFGYSQAQADAIVTTVNNLVADMLADRQLLNAVIDELQARNQI